MNRLIIFILLLLVVCLRALIWNLTSQKKFGYQQQEAVLLTLPRFKNGLQILTFAEFSAATTSQQKFNIGNRLRIGGDLDENSWFWYPKIEKLGQDLSLRVKILKWRETVLNQINSVLPEPQASLFNGILFGVDAIPEKFRQHLRQSGLIHLVVASGTNVSIVSRFLLALSGMINRRLAVFSALGMVAFYILLTGLEPPIVRAALMIGLSYLGELVGRRSWPAWILILSSMLMILIRPDYLTNLSFQLSFLATAGVILLTEPIQKKIQRWPIPGFAKMAVATSLAAQAMITPRLLSIFGEFSLVTPLTNALILILIEPLMFFGIGMSLVSLFGLIEPLKTSFLLVLSPLTIIVWVARGFGSFDFAFLRFPIMPFWLFLPWYFLLYRFLVKKQPDFA